MDSFRLQKIYLAAGRLFDAKGYANTKMAEIAKASGIAVGTMYSMFTGKDAVLTFVIRAALDKEYFSGEIELPVKPVETPVLTELLRKVSDDGFTPVLNITDKNGELCKDFCSLMNGLFDLFADYLLAFGNIEKNAEALEELNEVYNCQKTVYFEKLKENLKLYMKAGQIRNLTHMSAHVLFLTNTLTWWALNANLSFPDDPVPRNAAREICIGIINRAYQV